MQSDFSRLKVRSADSLESEKLRAIFHYWDRLRGDRKAPARAAFDPVHIPRLLSDLCLMEIVRTSGRMRFRYRVAGTGLADFVGQDFTNLFVDEVFAAGECAKIMEFYPAAAVLGRPVFSSFRLTYPQLDYPKVMRRLMLPLTGPGDDVDFLLNMQSYEGETGDTDGFSGVDDFKLLELYIVDR